MQILRDSLDVIRQDGSLLLLLLLCMLWGTLAVLAILKRFAKPDLTDASLAALSIAGWPLPVLLGSLLFFSLSLFLPFTAARSVTLLLAAAVLCASLWLLWRRVTPGVLWPLALFCVLAFPRLGYAAHVLLPPYFDSAWHYGLVQSLARMQQGAPLAWPSQGYYHLGYHLVLSAISGLAGVSLPRLMLLFGQLTLAALPIPLFFFIRSLTGSNPAALLGMTLAGFAWSMPAHAVDWGKYPALLGLLVAQFAVGCLLLQNQRLALWGILAAALIQTRMLVLLPLLGSGWLLARIERRWLKALLLLALGMETLLLYRDPALKPVLDTYLGWAGLLALLLGVLALQRGLHSASAALFWIVSMVAAQFVPLSGSLTVLDRPLVQMVLSLPLSFLAGLGAAYLNRRLTLAITLLFLLYSFSTQSFSPSSCCQLAGSDDLAALEWIEGNLPPDARLAIAARDLRLTSSGVPLQSTGSDAGIWVEPLTGRQVLPLSAYTDFSLPQTHELLCRQQVSYIYVGSGDHSFKLDHLPGYRTVFVLPRARILQLQGCP